MPVARSRWRAWVTVVGVAAAVQLLAVLCYRAIEGRRAPRLMVEPQAGAPRSALAGGRPLLLHFWATWCVPCRKELPGLLALGRRLAPDVETLAVSVDADWGAVRAFFPEGVPPEVVRTDPTDAGGAFGVSTLPDTRLLTPAGRTVARHTGARDWTLPAVEAEIRDSLEIGR